MKLRFGSLAFGAVLLAASSLSAQVSLVSWGPSSSQVTATRASQRTTSGGGLDFDLSTPITTSNAEYLGGAYYGGVVSANVASMSAGVSIRNAAFGDGTDAQIFGKAAAEIGYSATGVFLWKQANFLSGNTVSTDNVTLTSMTYNALLLTGSGTNLEGRFVIQQGSSYMISNNIGLAAFAQVRTSSNLSSLTWFSYTPVARSIGSAAIGAQITSPSFSGVTAAGLYLSGESTAASGFVLAFSQFAASGTVSAIPEPSSAAALAGAGMIAFAISRRRKR